MIQSFGSTQKRDLSAFEPTDERDFLVPSSQKALATTFGRMPRLLRSAHDEGTPGPGAYSPIVSHNSGSQFPRKSFQRAPTRTGPPPAFNSTAARVLEVNAKRDVVPGAIYDPVDAASSKVHALGAERALAIFRAGGRPRWADTAESSAFVSKAPRTGAWLILAEPDAPGPGSYDSLPMAKPERPKTAFEATERRFRPTSEGGARLVGSDFDHRSWPGPGTYEPRQTYRAASYQGLLRPNTSALPVTASFNGPPRFQPASRPPEPAMPQSHARALVAALANGEVSAGSRAVRWPSNRHFSKFEGRWRATALASS